MEAQGVQAQRVQTKRVQAPRVQAKRVQAKRVQASRVLGFPYLTGGKGSQLLLKICSSAMLLRSSKN